MWSLFLKKLLILSLLCLFFFGKKVFCYDISFNPGIDFEEEYNDNILFSYNYCLEDFVTRINPKFRLNLTSEQTDISLNSKLSFENFLHNSELNTVKTNNVFLIKENWNLKNLSNININFIKDSTLETELQQAGIVAKRTDRYNYGLSLSHNYILNETISFSGGGTLRRTHYPDNYYPDMKLWGVNLNPIISISSKDIMGLFINYYNADYENDTTIKTFSSDLYWSKDLNNTLKLTFGTGYRITWSKYYEIRYLYFLEPILHQLIVIPIKQRKKEKNTGLIFRFNLQKAWTKRFSTTITANRVQYNTTTATSSVVNNISTSFNYKLKETIGTQLLIKYSKTKEETSNGKKSNYFFISPVLNWRLDDNLSLSFGTNYEYVKHKRPNYNKHRYKCWIRITYSYPRLFATH